MVGIAARLFCYHAGVLAIINPPQAPSRLPPLPSASVALGSLKDSFGKYQLGKAGKFPLLLLARITVYFLKPEPLELVPVDFEVMIAVFP